MNAFVDEVEFSLVPFASRMNQLDPDGKPVSVTVTV